MKPRARRITMGAAVLVAVLVAVLAVANWGTVRDHVQAWHFQATRRTATMIAGPRCGNQGKAERLCFELSALSGRPVIFAPDDDDGYEEPLPQNVSLRAAQDVSIFLRQNGYRVLEQRLPRRAYVVIRDAAPPW